jgi:hypothetical protein
LQRQERLKLGLDGSVGLVEQAAAHVLPAEG